MTAYKIISDKLPKLKGRYFYPIGNEVMLLANFTEGQLFYYAHVFHKLKEEGGLEEVELLEQTWLHPHLYKPIQDEVRKQLTK
jgi:hypothetical protein